MHIGRYTVVRCVFNYSWPTIFSSLLHHHFITDLSSILFIMTGYIIFNILLSFYPFILFMFELSHNRYHSKIIKLKIQFEFSNDLFNRNFLSTMKKSSVQETRNLTTSLFHLKFIQGSASLLLNQPYAKPSNVQTKTGFPLVSSKKFVFTFKSLGYIHKQLFIIPESFNKKNLCHL